MMIASRREIITFYRRPDIAHRGHFTYHRRVISNCRLPLLLGALLALTPPLAAQEDAAEAERALNQVRERIGELQAEMRGAGERRSDAQQALRETELAERRLRRELSKTAQNLDATRARLTELEAEQARQQSALTGYTDALSGQLRAAYMTGRRDWLRTLLNREDPAAISRRLTHGTYISRRQASLMEEVRGALAALLTVLNDVERERAQFAQLQREQQTRLDELSASRKARSQLLARIDAEIAQGEGEVASLQSEAANLESLVAELTRLLAELPAGDAVPFGDRQGEMAWPVIGRIAAGFGQSRAGGKLRWDGVLIRAAVGDEVRAVHHGRVIYADWLPGMGLLIVLEHGDGFMSLYGHNQDLLRDVGEWVTPKTVIAHVGDSGGQADPGLYFEIRRNGSPVDPGRWIDR